MKLSHRLLWMLALLLTVGLLVLTLGSQYFVKHWVESNLLDSAEKVRAVLMSTRHVYLHQFIESELPLNDRTLGFLPAHALHRISLELKHWDQSGFSFNNVSDRPRNPLNQADAVEMAAIEHFRAHPEETLRFVPFVDATGRSYYLYARPIRVEKHCLQCHGERRQAPESIRLTFDSAYDYAEGDLRGILSIKIPSAGIEAQARAGLVVLIGVGILILSLMGIGMAWVLARYVIRPVDLLEQHIQKAGRGDLSQRIVDLPGEFGRVGQALNRMADHLVRAEALNTASENRYRALVEQSAAGIFIIQDGRFRYVNPYFARLAGYESPAEFIEHVGFPDLVVPEQRDMMEEALRRLQRGDTSGHLDTFTGMRRDGTRIDVEVHGNVIDLDGHPAIIGLFIDIGARKAAEEALRQRNEELERISRATVGRELDIIEMKKRINALSSQLGQPPPYDLGFLDADATARGTP